MHWDYLVILSFLGAIVPVLGRRRVQQLLRQPETTKADRFRLYASTVTFQWLAASLIVWRGEVHGMNAEALGLTLPKPALTIAVSIGLGVFILANQLVSLHMMTHKPEQARGPLSEVALRIFPQDRAERIAFFFIVITVAICEELIYRGFIQQLFTELTGGMVQAGILISAAFFSVAHLYQGRRGLTTTCVVGALFSVVRTWTGTQIPGIIGHFIADLTAGFLLPKTLKHIIAAEQEPTKP